ncbi:MAG: hypothetical protein HY980_00235 [Candidatus Magasanikbacteria bacterium]|nr:hypothetical protein [Candidatus Magasanikbacteria bacterium]
MWVLVFQRMLLEFFLDLIYFPLWWYTGGAKKALIFCYHLIQDANQTLAPGLWLRNIFVPMFGQTDWQGRLLSVFMRIMNVIVRAIAMGVWLAVVAVIFSLWLAFPIFVVYMMVL